MVKNSGLRIKSFLALQFLEMLGSVVGLGKSNEDELHAAQMVQALLRAQQLTLEVEPRVKETLLEASHPARLDVNMLSRIFTRLEP